MTINYFQQILHQSSYGLKGIYPLEECYAPDLQAYYNAFSIGEPPNCYFGQRSIAELQFVFTTLLPSSLLLAQSYPIAKKQSEYF